MNGPFHDALSCRCVFVMSIHLDIHQFLAHDAVASSVEEIQMSNGLKWNRMEVQNAIFLTKRLEGASKGACDSLVFP